MKRILLVCPSAWDFLQLPACRSRWDQQYDLIFRGPDDDQNPSTFDALAFIEATLAETRAQPIDGVASASDYPGAMVVAALAQALGLPGPAPEAVLRSSHKYYARLAQREAVPEATPAFGLIDPDRPDPQTLGLRFPLFVKPVKSWFSWLAQRVESEEELRALLAQPAVKAHLLEFVRPFNQLIERYTDFQFNGSYLLAEELLAGQQVTVEGFVCGGEVTVIGVVDSVMYPGTISFQRFDYPSALSARVQTRMVDIATRVMRHIGFDGGLFNIEMFYDPERDRVCIIEINPRMCGQFADLVEKVNGTNTYEILLALAAAERPVAKIGQGPYKVAASFVLRAFRDQRVVRVPSLKEIADVQRQFPGTLVKVTYSEGQRLAETDEQSDGYSYRYGLVHMGAQDRRSLLANFEAARRRLGWVLEDVD